VICCSTNTTQASASSERLKDLILEYISNAHHDDHLYLLAEICLSNAQLGSLVFDSITFYMATVTDQNVRSTSDAVVDHYGITLPQEGHLQRLRACCRFLKCSYWLPEDRYHYITPVLLSWLIACIGKDDVDDYIHDTLSSLLSLLTRASVTVLKTAELPDAWVQPDHASNKPVLVPGVLSDSFFDCFQHLPYNYFYGNASKAFRSWFQWLSYMSANAVETSSVYDPDYWSALRIGLVNGMADQRKYCLGIIQQSLLFCDRSFEASGMTFHVNKKDVIVEQYKKYCALFEIIVLDRYPNQVQACLHELTTLLGPTSLISPTWTTALLAAALNSKIQEGVRKLVGNWYLDYATSQPESCTTHGSFLIEGLLPWATLGSLFTASLVSTRTSTTCVHGTALADVFASLVVASAKEEPISEAYSPHTQEPPVVSKNKVIIRGVLQYLSDTDGKIFSPAVLYLLEGLLKGISQGGVLLDASEINMIVGISRMPALPEISADLCRAYCAELCGYRSPQIPDADFIPAQAFLDKAHASVRSDAESGLDVSPTLEAPDSRFEDLTTLKRFLEELERSRHKIISNDKFAPGCIHIIALLGKGAPESFLPDEVLQILHAFWEEADRQDYSRPVALRLAPLFFHSTCTLTCLRQRQDGSQTADDLMAAITKAFTTLHRLAEGRTYLWSGLATSLRTAAFLHPDILSVLPFEDFFVRFIENPPVPKKEFLFEAVAAEKLQEHLPRLNHGKHVPDRDFEAYYGKREWAGYAALIDLLNRMPESQTDVAKRIMKRLLEPWRTQKAPIPIISKLKNVLQLQMMLLLSESCVGEEDADWYLDSLMCALVIEPWPRYRYLLEWIIARIYYRFPNKAHRMLEDLAHLDDNSPVHIASLIKLALLTAPFLNSEDFALKFMVQLIPFSASPKVHIRHEAHWCFPTLFDLAKERNWTSITDNLAFVALDKHVRALDKFSAPASTIRTLRLDAVEDFTLTNIFQGRYLSIETPDMQYVAHEDFVALAESDITLSSKHYASNPRVPLGQPLATTDLTPAVSHWKKPAPTAAPSSAPATDSTPTFHQTKSGFDIASLLPSAGPPSSQQSRPASVILVASLIDNPTNLGGLSRT
jgi:tRNA guanosine-2'-O-methyltransferase